MKKQFAVRVLALAICGLLSVSMPAFSGEKVVFKLSHNFTPIIQAMHIALEGAAENINQRTNGAIVIQIYPNAEIANGIDGIEQCLRGAEFINVYDPSCMVDWVPDYNALIGPMLYESAAEYSAMCQTDFAKSMNKKAEDAGLKVLALDYTFGPRNIATSRKQIKTVEDLSGMKIRVPKSQLWVETFLALGACPVATSWSEVYNSLQQGVVDGMESSNSDMQDSALHEVVKYIANTRHFIGTTAVVTSKKVWDRLTPEQQQIMQEEISAGAARNNELSLKEEAVAQAKMEAAGVIFVDPDLDGFRSRSKAAFDKFPGLTPGIYDAIQKELAAIRNK